MLILKHACVWELIWHWTKLVKSGVHLKFDANSAPMTMYRDEKSHRSVQIPNFAATIVTVIMDYTMVLPSWSLTLSFDFYLEILVALCVHLTKVSFASRHLTSGFYIADFVVLSNVFL